MTTLSQSQSAEALAEAIAQRCEKARLHGDTWQACCPSHDDTTPSLSITASGDKVLVHCFGGCEQQAVVHALGLTMADLFVTPPQARRNGHKRIVKVYDYTDAQGILVHQTVRYDPKTFKQRRPDPANPDDYIWKNVYQALEPVLYNLPAVLAAIAQGAIIHLAEGEKDAETLMAHGLVATTVPMGAAYWRESYTTTLTGVHVVVWPDNDTAGQEALEKVQRHLTGKAAPLRVVTVPAPHKDVSDWVQAGATQADLEALVQGASAPAAAPEPAACEAPPATWCDQLNTTKGGEPKETFGNLLLALEHLDPWDSASWYDVVREIPMCGTAPLSDALVGRAALAIERASAIPIRNLRLVQAALVHHCRTTARDPLREWVEALPPWDGVERLTEWFSDHTDAPKTAYVMDLSRLIPVCMVARALNPGCQYRSVVIIEGPENIGKSQLVKSWPGLDSIGNSRRGLRGRKPI